jgi:hypothetical protein
MGFSRPPTQYHRKFRRHNYLITAVTTFHSSSFCFSLSLAVPIVSPMESTVSRNNSSPANDVMQYSNDHRILLHPADFGEIPFPTHLSPSSALEFRECPQSFLFQYLYNLRQPTSLVLAKGSMCHKALEHIFDLEPEERTLQNLQNMLRVHWNEQRLKEEYKFLFETETGDRDDEAEREWGQSALLLLDNYYRSEDPRTVVRPNPYKREVWVNANLTVEPQWVGSVPSVAVGNVTNADAMLQDRQGTYLEILGTYESTNF